MRTLPIEPIDKGIEAFLLLQDVGGRRTSRFLFQCEVPGDVSGHEDMK